MKPSAFPRLARTGSPVACILATAIAILLAQPSAQAANTYTFTPTSAGTYDWTAVGNWSASGVPVSANDATVAFFSDITTALTGAVTIHTDPATLTLNTLTLNGLAPATAAAANSIGTAGNTWTFDGTTPTLNLNGKSGTAALSYTLKPNIVLNQPLTFAGVGSAGLALSGVISGSGMGITHNGIQNVGDKASKITLNGSAVNTFTGGVTINGCNTGYGAAAINGSTLLLDFANLGTTGTDLINSGNALTLGGGTLALQGKGSATDSQTFASTTLSPKTGSRIKPTTEQRHLAER